MLFSVTDIPPKSGTVKGVNAIKLDKGDRLIGFALTHKKREGLTVRTNRGRELVIRETSYRPVKRGGKGTPVLRMGQFVDCDWPPIIMAPKVENDTAEIESDTEDMQ